MLALRRHSGGCLLLLPAPTGCRVHIPPGQSGCAQGNANWVTAGDMWKAEKFSPSLLGCRALLPLMRQDKSFRGHNGQAWD